MASTEFKAFAVETGNDITAQAEYVAATWRKLGWRSGILPHQQINKALRQSSVVAEAVTQSIADLMAADIADDGDVASLVTKLKTLLSGNAPYNPVGTFAAGTLGAALQDFNLHGGSFFSTSAVQTLLTGSIAEALLTPALRSRIDLVDAPTTGLVTKVNALITSYGGTTSAAESAAEAAQSAIDAAAAANTSSIKAGEAYTSATNAYNSAVSASANNATAATSASNAASSASSAAGSASTASTQASNAATSASSAGTSASAAATSASSAGTSATNAATSATAANTSKLAADTARANAATSESNAASSATTANTAASVATTKAGLAATSESNAGSSASAAAASASTASTQATNAATSASAANTSKLAADTAAASATSSAASAVSAASTATTKAAEASTSATNAAASQSAALGSANAASSSASTAATQASNAATSATSANSSVNTATTKAAEAVTSATSAATSASTAGTAASNAATSATTAASAATGAGTSASAASISASVATARATDATNSANAAATHYTNTVSATGSLTAAVGIQATAISGLNGRLGVTEAQYTLKTVATRLDGSVVLGMVGVASTANNSGSQSVIYLQADRLMFVPSSDPNAVGVEPLTVGLVNGVTTLTVPAARIGDLTVGTRTIVNNAISTLLGISVNYWSVAQVTVVVTSDMLPSGSSTVPALVIASQDVTSLTYFDVALNPTSWLDIGNLMGALPPYGGAYASSHIVNLPVGTHVIACYNRFASTPQFDPNTRVRTIAVLIAKK